MKRKDLYMGTTEIDPVRTIGEIHAYLVRMGALRIMNSYDKGEPVAVHFILNIGGREIPFELPARVEPIYKIMHQGRGDAQVSRDMAQAKRTAWRQVYRWIQAQLALIETGMVDAGEVFYAYAQTGPNETLYQRAVKEGFNRLALAAKTETEEMNVHK